MDQLIKILQEIKPGVDFLAPHNLLEEGILDSLTIVILAGRLSDEFDIELTPLHIVPENFDTVEHLWAMVVSLED